MGQDLLLTVTQTLEQTNLHSHIHKLSVLIHARKHAKTRFAFRFLQPSKASPAPSPHHPGRVAARPGGEAQPGKRSWGWTDRQRDRGTEAACGSFTVRRGDAPGPGALSAGRKPKREELEQSSLAHPSAERRGGGTRAEERRCGIGVAVSGAGRSRAPAPSPHAPTGSGA